MKSVRMMSMIAIACAGALGFAQAQTPDTGGAGSADQHETTDRETGQGTGQGTGKNKGMNGSRLAPDAAGTDPATFVKKAALGGMTEVELGKVAQSRAQDAKVKAFADRMVRDHSKSNTELATLAKGKGLQVPASLDAEHQAKVKEVSGMSGAAFDTAYSKHMVMDHAKTIALFESAAKNKDTDLAAFASKTLPTLREHKQMADALPGATGGAVRE